jgi:hypothetical protein
MKERTKNHIDAPLDTPVIRVEQRTVANPLMNGYWTCRYHDPLNCRLGDNGWYGNDTHGLNEFCIGPNTTCPCAVRVGDL